MIRSLFRMLFTTAAVAALPRESAPEAAVQHAGRRMHAEDPHAFFPVARRHKSTRAGDRALNRSRYDPHQGAQEMARRRAL